MPSWTPPGSDSPLQEEKRVLNKHETTNKQHSVLALITRKGAAERMVGLESSNLRISFESFERCKLLEIKFMISFNIRLLLTSLNDSYESVLV